MHIKITNGTPKAYSISQLRQDNPAISFPDKIPADTLAEYGVFPAVSTSAPPHGKTEVAEAAGYLQLADGTWSQAWRVRPMNEQELAVKAQEIDAQRKMAYQLEADPLFFKWQAGEGTQEAWLAKRKEIAERFAKG